MKRLPTEEKDPHNFKQPIETTQKLDKNTFLEDKALFKTVIELQKQGMTFTNALKKADQKAKIAKIVKVAEDAAEKARQRTTSRLPGSTKKGGKRRKPRKTKKHRKKKSL